MSVGLVVVLLLALCVAGGVGLGVWLVRSFAPRAGVAGLAPTGALFLLGCLVVWLGAHASGAGALAVVPGAALVVVGLVGLFGCAVRRESPDRAAENSSRQP